MEPSITLMVLESKHLRYDGLMAYAFREAVGLDSIDEFERKKRLFGVGSIDRERDMRDIERLMRQRTGALDRVR